MDGDGSIWVDDLDLHEEAKTGGFKSSGKSDKTHVLIILFPKNIGYVNNFVVSMKRRRLLAGERKRKRQI